MTDSRAGPAHGFSRGRREARRGLAARPRRTVGRARARDRTAAGLGAVVEPVASPGSWWLSGCRGAVRGRRRGRRLSSRGSRRGRAERGIEQRSRGGQEGVLPVVHGPERPRARGGAAACSHGALGRLCVRGGRRHVGADGTRLSADAADGGGCRATGSAAARPQPGGHRGGPVPGADRPGVTAAVAASVVSRAKAPRCGPGRGRRFRRVDDRRGGGGHLPEQSAATAPPKLRRRNRRRTTARGSRFSLLQPRNVFSTAPPGSRGPSVEPDVSSSSPAASHGPRPRGIHEGLDQHGVDQEHGILSPSDYDGRAARLPPAPR